MARQRKSLKRENADQNSDAFTNSKKSKRNKKRSLSSLDSPDGSFTNVGHPKTDDSTFTYPKRVKHSRCSRSSDRTHSEHSNNSDCKGGLLDECVRLFGTNCLYTVLGVKRDALPSEIKKAYYKNALKYHPDKHNSSKASKQDMAAKFRVMCQAYQILFDTERRSAYDMDGSVDPTIFATLADDLMSIFRNVSVDAANNFLSDYKNSDQERKELFEHYNRFKGNWNKISECHVGYSVEEEPRLKAIVKEAIKSGEITTAFEEESVTSKKARHRKLEKEARKASKINLEDLAAQIQERRSQRAKNLSSILQNILKKEQLSIESQKAHSKKRPSKK